MRLEYIPYLRTRLLTILNSESGTAIEDVIQILDSYGLNRDDFMETLKDLQFIRVDDSILRDGYEKIDSKLKASLTRAYNIGEHHSQALISGQDTKKKSSKKQPTTIDEWGDYDDDEGPPEEVSNREFELFITYILLGGTRR